MILLALYLYLDTFKVQYFVFVFRTFFGHVSTSVYRPKIDGKSILLTRHIKTGHFGDESIQANVIDCTSIDNLAANREITHTKTHNER